MKISVISASHRKASQSERIANIISSRIKNTKPSTNLFNLDLSESNLPLWSPVKKKKSGIWGETWENISNDLKESDGFIFVVPEYGGMATPHSKNIFLLCGEGELAHKPGLIVSVSSGNGGAYPIADL